MEQPISSNTPTLKDYNTMRSPMKQPEYGRLVMQMVEHAITIENKELRQLYAEKIIKIMGNMNPQMKNVPNYKIKLWEHLAYMSDYQLDITYPVEIAVKEKGTHPQKLSYPGNKIVMRHYGFLIEQLMERLKEQPNLYQTHIKSAAERMKRNLIDWKGDSAENTIVAADIEKYTNGAIPSEKAIELLGKSNKTHNFKGKKGKR